MISITELVARAKENVAAERRLKELEEKAKGARGKVGAEANAEARALRERLEWTPRYFVHRVVRWRCQTCASLGSWSDGLFVLYEHNHLANSYRFVRPQQTGVTGADLPRRVVTERRLLSLCPECSERHGFSGRVPFLKEPT